MMKITDYAKVVGPEVVAEICRRAKKFENKRIVCVSSTHQGGGVAEILNSLVFLFNEIGINFGWRVLHGSPNFFSITKSFHNGLQGDDITLDKNIRNTYLETNERYSVFSHFTHDLVIIHDPQPLALINYYKKTQPWIWQCHIDITEPNKKLWNFLKPHILKYDAVVLSDETYKKDMPIEQIIMHPAIDPLIEKNRALSEKEAEKILNEVGINTDKPIITQISRFDHWKDPQGVIKIYKLVKKEVDCQLVLLGNTATDDPEGVEVFSELQKTCKDTPGAVLLANVTNNDLVVNALQTKAAVIIQKSIREGFSLTVSEGMYKGTPVVASNIGGIPLQVIPGETGFLHDPYDYNGFSESIIKLLKDENLRKKIGERAKKHVQENFLITRLILNWLDIFEKYL